MTLTQIQETVYRRKLDVQAIFRLVISDEFNKAWSKATQESKDVFFSLTRDCKRDGAIEWVQTQNKTDLSTMRLKDLRILAKKKDVKNYHHLDKATILVELSK